MKKNCFLFILSLTIFYFLPTSGKALTAAEVAARPTDCTSYELASAEPDGSLNKVACYNTYEETKQVMNSTANDNLVIVGNRRIVDAKYALIDYDQLTTAGYTSVYSDKYLSSEITYITGGDSDDAVFLELDPATGRIKIKVSGAVGWIKRYENEAAMSNPLYDIVPLSWVKSPSYYQVTSNDLIHHLPLNVYNTKGKNQLVIGKKPSMLNEGTYYSYDGNYFYTDLKQMINDYKQNTYQNAVNRDNPFYNYYQYLSFRTKTNYNAANINQFIDARTSNPNSKLKNTGDYFIENQNNYGINAIIMLAIGINESGYGTSTIAQTKNNLFGLNAIDKTPGESANYFASVADCIGEFAYVWLDYGYVQPGDYRFKGANLGNKGVGLNIKYASDPYWGEKAAQYYYDLDKYYGFQDYEAYTIAILNNNYNNTVYPKKTPGGLNVSSSFYQYKVAGTGVVVLEEVTGPAVNGNTTWYKIMSDPTLDGDLEYIGDSKSNPRVTYPWDTMHVYVPASYFYKVNSGDNTPSTPTDPEVPPENPEEPTTPPEPQPKPISSIVQEANYTYENGMISKIQPGTSVETLKGNLTNTGGVVTITDPNGNAVESGQVGTGYQVHITSGTTEVLTVLIYGDTDGDGSISAVDYVRVKNQIMSGGVLQGAYEKAADVNKDSTISAVDYVNIKNYIMGTDNVISN